MQETEKNSGDLLRIEQYLQLHIHEQGMNTLHAALAMALEIEQGHQASKILMPSHTQLWSSPTAGVFPASTVKVPPQSSPASSCALAAAIPSAVNLATSGDVSTLQRTLESLSDRVDQLQLEVSRQRYANSRPSPERQRRSFTPEGARGRTFKRHKYDRHTYDTHDRRGSDHRDSSGDRTYSASHQRENYHVQSPRGSKKHGQYKAERE